MRHIYLNKLYCTCFDFLLRTIHIQTNTQIHKLLIQRDVFVCSLTLHLPYTFARLYTCVCMFVYCCLPVFLRHIETHTQPQTPIYMHGECVQVVPWLRPQAETHGSDKNVKCIKIYQHSAKQTSLSLNCVVASVSTQSIRRSSF